MISKLKIIVIVLSLSAASLSSAEEAVSFAYPSHSYSLSESAAHIGVVYGVSWVLYPIFQPEIMAGEKGSWHDYRENLGRTVFDQDEPVWNWVVHPISGSQLFLFYRALGYERPQSFLMTFVSSALFEYTIEIYSEPASIQDLYQTPVLGTVFGYGLELTSTYLLQQNSTWARFLGRAINPLSFIADHGNTSLVPVSSQAFPLGLQLTYRW